MCRYRAGVDSGGGQMRRGRNIGLAITASLLAVAVAASTAYGVLELTDLTDTTSHAQDLAQEQAQADDSREIVSSPTLKAKPEPKPLFDRGDRGVGVRELQSRLKQLEWYAPDITGTYDRVTAQAVLGFQGKRGFEKTGTCLLYTSPSPRDGLLSRMP